MLDLVFEYRRLIGKCELGMGLDLDEIEQLTGLEQRLLADAEFDDDGRPSVVPRAMVSLPAIVRGDQINDRVELIELGPGGMVCRNAPFIARGERIDVVVELADRSYHFSGVGAWLCDDGDDYKVSIVFVGIPVCVHHVQVSPHEPDVIDEIADARDAAA